jgi:hypothetical protein
MDMDTHRVIATVMDAVSEDPNDSYLGWTPAKPHVVRNWWVPILLRKQGIVQMRIPRAQIRRIVAYDEPEIRDEAPHAYTMRALEWGSFNAAALLM